MLIQTLINEGVKATYCEAAFWFILRLLRKELNVQVCDATTVL
jgi:hypothetical protein